MNYLQKQNFLRRQILSGKLIEEIWIKFYNWLSSATPEEVNNEIAKSVMENKPPLKFE